MRDVLVSTLAAGGLAFGFASVGEILLGRSSRTLSKWNESFLIGIGFCAALLFPLTLVAPRQAMTAELGIVLVSVLAAAWQRVRLRNEPGSGPRESEDLESIAGDPVAIFLLAALISVSLFFAALNLWQGHAWDSVQVWATKAQMLFVEGGLPRQWFPEESYDVRLLAYPPLISFFEAALSRLRGSFDFDRLKSIFPFLYLSVLIATFAAARKVCSRRWALAMVLLVALLPEMTMGPAAGGYVDMPLAAFVAAVVAASLRTDGSRAGWRTPLPWLIGALTTVKQEGMLLALITCVAIAMSWILERPRRLSDRLRTNWTAALVVLGFIVARGGYVRWVGVHDTTWGPFDAEHFSRAFHSLGLVGSLCLRYMVDPLTWGLFWPAFFVGALVVLASGRQRPALLILSTAAAILGEAAIFLFTNWEIAVHIQGAYARLLVQLAPAAAVVIGAAGEQIWSDHPREPR